MASFVKYGTYVNIKYVHVQQSMCFQKECSHIKDNIAIDSFCALCSQIFYTGHYICNLFKHHLQILFQQALTKAVCAYKNVYVFFS